MSWLPVFVLWLYWVSGYNIIAYLYKGHFNKVKNSSPLHHTTDSDYTLHHPEIHQHDLYPCLTMSYPRGACAARVTMCLFIDELQATGRYMTGAAYHKVIVTWRNPSLVLRMRIIIMLNIVLMRVLTALKMLRWGRTAWNMGECRLAFAHSVDIKFLEWLVADQLCPKLTYLASYRCN